MLTAPIIKQPAEQRFHALAFDSAIAAIDSIAIAARGLVAAVTPLTIGSQAVDAGGAKLRLDGGTDGESYLVTVKATTADGELLEAEAEIHVVDLAFAMPDGSTPYLSIAEFVKRSSLAEAIRLTDETGTGRIDAERLKTAITDAQSDVDSYLAKRFSAPITAPVPQRITRLVYDLALASLYRGDLPDNVKAGRDAATKALRDLSTGVATLPEAELPAPTPASTAPVMFEGGDREFTRDSMRGY